MIPVHYAPMIDFTDLRNAVAKHGYWPGPFRTNELFGKTPSKGSLMYLNREMLCDAEDGTVQKAVYNYLTSVGLIMDLYVSIDW